MAFRKVDEGDHFTAVNVEIDVLQNRIAANGDTDIFHPQAAGMAAGTTVKGKSHCSASFIVLML